MSQFRESTLPGIADSSLAGAGRYVRVKITGAPGTDLAQTVGLAGVNDVGVGVIDSQQANAVGDQVNIWLNNDNKTKIMVAAGAITAGSFVYAAASGQIAATGTVLVGIALFATTSAGDFVEVLPIVAVGNSAGSNVPPTILSGSTDAIPPHLTETYVVTTAGIDAMTLAAPTAGTDDGVEITVFSGSAYAHTITATGLLQTGSANVNVATFAAHPGASVTLKAYNGKWMVRAQNTITFS
jgi:hypothetical protein